MYEKIILNGFEVKMISMEKMNVIKKLNHQKNRSSIKDEKKRYYYNQKRKKEEIKNTILVNFKEQISCFATLTIAESEMKVEEANKNFERFIRKMKSDYNDFRYVATIEIQKRGAVHYHLICNIENELNAIESINNYWLNIEKDVKLVYDTCGLAEYMTKEFLIQDSSSILFNKKPYKNSKNLKAPIVVKSWNTGKGDFQNLKSILTKGKLKKKSTISHEKAGLVEYKSFEMPSDLREELFGDYIVAIKKNKKKKLQF